MPRAGGLALACAVCGVLRCRAVTRVWSENLAIRGFATTPPGGRPHRPPKIYSGCRFYSPRRIRAILHSERGGLFIPAPVCAKVDYLLGRRFGQAARHAFLDDLAKRRFQTPGLDADGYTQAAELDRRYGDLELELSDLSLIVLARRLDTRRLLTFDERRFRAVRPLQGGAFTILPAEAESRA